eukprot:tig00001003_g6264.t1
MTSREPIIREESDEDEEESKPTSGNAGATSDLAKQDNLEVQLAEMLDDDLDGLEEIDEDMNKFQQDDLVKDALLKGVDLREYAREVEANLREVEKASITDYIKESNNLASLHSQIRQCDAVLERMEKMLSGFQGDLGSISSEIKHLQDESMSMNIKVRNRKAAEKKLGKFIERVVVPPDLITNICDGEVNEGYVEYLQQLDRKIESIEAGSTKDTLASRDLEPQIEKLRMKAVAKVREFLLTRIHALKKPKTNIQIIQQNVLLKFKYFNQFLADNGREAFLEVRETYVDILSKIYQQYFKGYIASLAKLQYDVANKNDLLGVDEKESRTLFGAKPDPKARYAVFSLGERGTVLQEVENPQPIIPHMAAQAGHKFTFEFIFRSVMLLLMDTCTAEYLFCVDFFGRNKDMFSLIFARTIALVVEAVEAYVASSYDCIGVLLMIRVTQQQQAAMLKRRVPVLDALFDRYNLLLWPRFKAIFDAHVDSVRQAQSVKRLWTTDVHPHYMTRRYAELSAALSALNREAGDDSLRTALATLRLEVAKLIARMAAEHSQHIAKIVFLINNYDLITGVCAERGVESEDGSYFGEQLAQQTSFFVEEELGASYGKLISFVKRTEPLLSAPTFNPERPPVDPAEVEKLVKEFNARWKQGIEGMNADVMKYFSNFKIGMEILKQALTQLLLYYTRFLDIVKKCFKNPPFSRDIVSIPNIMYEIRQYSRQI